MTREQLKNIAKAKNSNSWWKIFLTLLICALICIVPIIAFSWSPITNLFLLLLIIMMVFILLPASFFSVYIIKQVTLICLKVKTVSVRHIFEPFNMGKKILYMLGSQLLKFLILLGGFILLIFPAIIFYYSLSMVDFIMCEKKNTTPVEAIKLSFAMTKGHKFELFVKDLSFLGWQLLSIFTFSILQIWLTPYTLLTAATYYEYLKKRYVSLGGDASHFDVDNMFFWSSKPCDFSYGKKPDSYNSPEDDFSSIHFDTDKTNNSGSNNVFDDISSAINDVAGSGIGKRLGTTVVDSVKSITKEVKNTAEKFAGAFQSTSTDNKNSDNKQSERYAQSTVDNVFYDFPDSDNKQSERDAQSTVDNVFYDFPDSDKKQSDSTDNDDTASNNSGADDDVDVFDNLPSSKGSAKKKPYPASDTSDNVEKKSDKADFEPCDNFSDFDTK